MLYTDFEFVCNNGHKIKDKEQLCNRIDDCGDNSDEVTPCTRTVACDFESKNYCGYTLGGWSGGNGLASLSGSLFNTGPSFDHTSGLADGSHTYMFTSVNGAILTSPEHSNSTSTCLQLYYYISSSSKLHIHRGSISGALITTIEGAADKWQSTRVTLPAGTYLLVIRAEITRPSYVAVDDVVVSAGACSSSCPNGMFTCTGDSQCVPSSNECDKVAQCTDSSDEHSGCPSVSKVTCSFDKPFACGFRQSDNDDFNWEFRYGVSKTSVGPPTGHTDSEEDAADDTDVTYLIAIAPMSFGKAVVEWPLKMSEHSCMTFWYYMYGSNAGSLTVSSDGKTLWQMFGNQGERWIKAHVAIQAGKGVQMISRSGEQVSHTE